VATDKRLSGLRTQEPKDLKGVTIAPLPHGIDIPTIEAVRESRFLELLGLDHLEDLSAVQVLLWQTPFVTETPATATVPVASAAPLGLTSDVDVVEEPVREANSSSATQKTERRRRAKANAKMTQLSTTRRLDDFRNQLKRYRTMLLTAEMRRQQQLVMTAWAALSARRRDATKQRQLGSQRRTYAERAIEANLDHERQLVLRSWSAVAADSLKARTHQQELDALRSSTSATTPYASTDSDCPLPPGLWNFATSAEVQTASQPPSYAEVANPAVEHSSSCGACLSGWGCLQHSVYSSKLFLAQRELGMKIGRGPPGLMLEEEAMEGPATHLRVAPVELQGKPTSARQLQRKQWRQKAAKQAKQMRS